MCVRQSQCALIQYSKAPMVLLHQGNIKSSSITASPCFTNCSCLHRLRTGLNHQAGRDSLQIPFRTAKWTQIRASYSVTLYLHKAWYLMHRCGGRRWWTGGKAEVDVQLAECKAVKTDPCLWSQEERQREMEGERWEGEKCEGDWKKEG